MVRNQVLTISPLPSLSISLLTNVLGAPLELSDFQPTPYLSTCPYEIDTKYYHASVNFIFNKVHLNECDLEPVDDYEGLILVVPSSSAELRGHVPAEFDLAEWIGGWAEFIERAAPSLLLCVVMGPHADPTYIARLAEACTNNSIELIHEYPSSASASDREEEEEDDPFASEKQGVERVVEALQTTMWENMELKTDARPVLLDSARRRGSDADMHAAAQALAHLSVSSQPAPTPPAQHQSATELEFSEFQGASAHLPADTIQQLESFLKKTRNPSADEEPTEETAVLDDGDFAGTLSALRGLRAHAQTLPDSDRRALAAQVALMLGGWEDEEA